MENTIEHKHKFCDFLEYAEKSKKIISQDLENFKKQTNGE